MVAGLGFLVIAYDEASVQTVERVLKVHEKGPTPLTFGRGEFTLEGRRETYFLVVYRAELKARQFKRFQKDIEAVLEQAGARFDMAPIGAVKYRFLLLSEAEAPREGQPGVSLERGLCYLVREERPEAALEMFADLVTHGAPGLCFTRSPPKRIRDTHRLHKTPIVWIGQQPPSREFQAVEDLEELSFLIAKFLRERSEGVVLINALEYLVQTKGFPGTLKFLYGLREIVAHSNARLILSVDPRSLEAKELSLLEREMECLKAEK
ncbi:MAG: DUF835 domain-containing protein [Euryarchaeota archaeon]|nr:DUF835 domain-containing protein [Euryarchaeota archaeon]